jgi:4-hydroxyphenylpyruvate dioxygenase
MMSENNPCGLKGIEFVEYASNDPQKLHNLFKAFGFSKTKFNETKNSTYYNQNDIHFLINDDKTGHSAEFTKAHGPCISSMGLRVENAQKAFEISTSKGAKPATGEYSVNGKAIPCIYGIGDSLLYFIEDTGEKNLYEEMGFAKLDKPEMVDALGFLRIDHLTNNVYKGTMETWSNFYKDVFGFTEVRYFDIKGVKTGLVSYALQSPCQTFCIPINEGTDKKSQINEYLEEYNGPGIQHIAFLTEDIVSSVSAIQGSNIDTLDIDKDYYEEVFDRVPNVTEDKKALEDLNILVDGDEEGYLLQIFTKTIIGPIFIEIIQRKNHYSFGEGNFGALFRSIEKDQEERGYLE